MNWEREARLCHGHKLETLSAISTSMKNQHKYAAEHEINMPGLRAQQPLRSKEILFEFPIRKAQKYYYSINGYQYCKVYH